MADLSTSYLGLKLKNPIIAGASNLSTSIEKVKAMEEAGVAAIVFKSLFEEQINLEAAELDEDLEAYNERHAEMITLFPDMEHAGPQEHLLHLKKIKQNTSIPIIASLNAIYEETWVEYAKMIEETGVDALELNLFSVPKKFELTASETEELQLEIVKRVKKAVKIPVSVKISSFYSNPLNFIKKLDALKVDGIVIFNRLFEPEIDIHEEKHTFPFNLSNKGDYRLALRYAGLLHGQINADVAAASGIFEGEEVVKLLLAGADTVQVVSTLYKNKIEHATRMIRQINAWMDEKGYQKIDDFKGQLARKNTKDPFVYLRAQYVDALLHSSEKIIKSFPAI
ncbi:MAG: dihydroorotate dehydrogenase-like protein [Bacteroidales bacterium]|jgi:dihydroorotate dehydrogenase (fumarate)|nr:dihydroorotate dehydrogenase-like protein [Bacteroidales bacterium]